MSDPTFFPTLPLADLPDGEMAEASVEGKHLALARVGDTIYAFSNACPHQMLPLSEGILKGEKKKVLCRWHGWSFNIETGEAISPKAGPSLGCYATRIIDGMIHVSSTART